MLIITLVCDRCDSDQETQMWDHKQSDANLLTPMYSGAEPGEEWSVSSGGQLLCADCAADEPDAVVVSADGTRPFRHHYAGAAFVPSAAV